MCLNKGREKYSPPGQALIELSVFGALFMLILASLISYGLRYNFQQRAQMTAFRRALQIATDKDSGGVKARGSAAYTLLQDKHIPDPGDMFGMGSSVSITSSASVTRDFLMHEVPVDKESLPGMVMDIQTARADTAEEWQRRIYKTAGFRLEHNVFGKELVGKYKLIFGLARRPAEGSTDLIIMDACSGEIVDYGTCYAQARMLVDPGFCWSRCATDTRRDDSRKARACKTKCNAITNPPNQVVHEYNPAAGGAWYAHGWHSSDGRYVFPLLDEMFSQFGGAGRPEAKSLGPQKDTVTDSVKRQSIQKRENARAITTDEAAAWTDTVHRTIIVRRSNLDADGYERTHTDPRDFIRLRTIPVSSVISGTVDEQWRTRK